MPNPFNITISDTSPIFQYRPSRDGPINSSWNASFSGSSDSTWVPQALGVGTSTHRTTLRDASAQLDWLGTGIYLYGESAGTYTIELDGTLTNVGTRPPGLLFAKSGLTYGPHSVILHVSEGTYTTSISSAIITVGMGEPGTIIQNRTIDTFSVPLTTDGIVLSGEWVEHRMEYGIGGPIVSRIATNVANSAISFPISSASAFYIIGGVNFDHGPYFVTFTPPPDLGVGSMRTFSYNGSSRWVGLNTVIFLATGLDRTRTYHVQVTNQANLYYDQSQIVILDTPPDPSNVRNPNPNTGPNPSPKNTSHQPLSVGAVTGIAIGLFSCLIILIFLVVLRKWRKRRSSRAGGLMTQHSAIATSPSNPPMPTVFLPFPATTQEWVPPEYGTTDLRPLQPISVISRSERNPPLPTSTFATHDVSRPLRPGSMISQSERNLPLTASTFPTPEASRPLPGHPVSMISQSEPLSSSTSYTTPDVSPPYPISGDLTQEDARFFNNLYALNVPAADIATMMEALRAEREVASASRTEGFVSSGATPVEPQVVNTVPPGYDFKDSK